MSNTTPVAKTDVRDIGEVGCPLGELCESCVKLWDDEGTYVAKCSEGHGAE